MWNLEGALERERELTEARSGDHPRTLPGTIRRVYREPHRPPRTPTRTFVVARVPRLVAGLLVVTCVGTFAVSTFTGTGSIDVTCGRSGAQISCEATSRQGWHTGTSRIAGARVEVSTARHEESSEDGLYETTALVLATETERQESLALEAEPEVSALAARLGACLASAASTCEDGVHVGWLVFFGSTTLGALLALFVAALFPTTRLEHDPDDDVVRVFSGRLGLARLVFEGPRGHVRFAQRFEVIGDDADIHVLEAIVEGGATYKIARGGEPAMKEREKAVNAFLR